MARQGSYVGLGQKIQPRRRMTYLDTSCVITLGPGILGWAKLWRSIVFCGDGLRLRELREVPLPLPLAFDDNHRESLGHPRIFRGLCFINGRLWLTEVEWDFVELAGKPDPETKLPRARMDGWTITTWSNTKMTDSYDDWVRHETLSASDIAFDVARFSESEMPAVALQNLFVSESDPAFDINNSDVVYLTAGLQFLRHQAWVLAVDLKNHRVQSVVNSGPRPQGLPRIN